MREHPSDAILDRWATYQEILYAAEVISADETTYHGPLFVRQLAPDPRRPDAVSVRRRRP